MVVPVASMRVAPDGIVTLPDVPIAVMRLPVMTMSALGRTSSPFIVTTRAPVSARTPLGASRGSEIAMWNDSDCRDARLLGAFAPPRLRPCRSCLSASVSALALAFSAAFALCASANAIASAIVRRWNVAPSVQVIARPWSAQAA